MAITSGPRNPSIQVEREGGPSAPSRSPLPGSPDGNIFRSTPAPATEQQAGAGTSAAFRAPQDGSTSEAPRDEIAELRAAVAAKAEERRSRAADVRRREKGLAEREAKLDQVEKRLQAWRQQPQLALEDLAQFGIPFDALANAAISGARTPEQIEAALRGEIEQIRSGVQDALLQRDQREATERTTAQRQAEAQARQEFTAELAEAAEAAPDRYPLVRHFGDRASAYSFQKAEEIFVKTGKVPTHDQVLDAVEQDLAREIEGATSARGRRPAPAGSQPRGFDTGRAGESAAERRARFLGTLGGILKGIK